MIHVRELFDLTDTVALVTGASHEPGRAMAKALGEAGARLVLTADDADAPYRSAAARGGQGTDAAACTGEAAQSEAAAQIVDRALTTWGRIDVLVNSADCAWASTAETPPHEWRRILDVNVMGMFLMTQAVGRAMLRSGGGRIVNISHPARDYGISRGAVIAMTRDLAVKWARHGITVNAIVREPFDAAEPPALTPGGPGSTAGGVRLARPGSEDDLAGAVVFFASRAAGFVTGQVLRIGSHWPAEWDG
jgi:NAD(P)-dependent dehydrogenase (short-subunit alcohol dehydrogenase family)